MNDLFVPLFSGLSYSKEYSKELWALTTDKLTDVSAGPVSYIDSDLELQTIPAGVPAIINDKIFNFGSWKEYCKYPTLPSSWAPAGAIIQPTGNSYGAFQEVRIAGPSASWNRADFYKSSLTNNPSGSKQFCSLLYKIGTSLSGKIICRDSTSYAESQLSYYGTSWVISTPSAGALSIVQDVEVFPGIRLLCFTITWTTRTHSLSIGVGPNSTAGLNIVSYGASVNEIGNIWPIFNPTGGTTITSRSGVAYCGLTNDENLKLKTALYGTDGTDAASKITFTWKPYYNSINASVAQTIFKTGSKTIVVDNISGNVLLNDGTTTTTCALTSWSAGDTMKFELLYGDNHPSYPGINKMQMRVSKDGGETWVNSSVVNFDGSMINPGDTQFYCGGDTLPQAISDLKAWTLKSGDWPT